MTPTTPTAKRSGVTTRLTTEIASRRRIVTIIGPGNLIGFRLHGTRKVYETTVGACYWTAVKAHAAASKAEKAAKRKARRA